VVLCLGSCSARAEPGLPNKEGEGVGSDAALLARIRAVDPVHADTMSRQPTTFTVEAVPFYRRFKLVRAAVDLPTHPLEFHYLDGGSRLVHLTGKPADVYGVNEAEGLALAQAQVAPYVRFFLAHTTGDGGEERELAETPADLVWLPATERDPSLKAARAAAAAHIRPLAVSAAPGGYRVVATVAEGLRLVELVLKVDGRGRITVDGSRVLVEELPVAETL
jgi:hypothetical protein